MVGLIDNDSGSVNVTVWYSAILLRPFPLEVLDAVVTNANEVFPFVSMCHETDYLILVWVLLSGWSSQYLCQSSCKEYIIFSLYFISYSFSEFPYLDPVVEGYG
jgi:hypothetical protein